MMASGYGPLPRGRRTRVCSLMPPTDGMAMMSSAGPTPDDEGSRYSPLWPRASNATKLSDSKTTAAAATARKEARSQRFMGCAALSAHDTQNGGRDRDRTCDPYHVKVVLFR